MIQLHLAHKETEAGSLSPPLTTHSLAALPGMASSANHHITHTQHPGTVGAWP